MELTVREETLNLIKKQLEISQARMKRQVDKGRSELVFSMDDWVLVRLKSYRKSTMASRFHNKLCKHYFGPFKIIHKISHVPYKLKLPQGSLIHDMFHVSKLKKFNRPFPKIPIVDLILDMDNKPIIYHTFLLDYRTIFVKGKPTDQYLVQ